MKQKRLLILLALLMTAATGAWAQDAANLKVYYNELNTPVLYNSMTKIDANGDDNNGMYGCWVLQDYATYIYSSQNKDADDWLVTTGIELEAGVTYTIALEAIKPSPQEHTYTETFEVRVGTEATADALSAGTQVIKTTEVTTSWTNYHRTFTPTTSGTYYVGIHATSPKDQSQFSIRNLTVDIKYYTLSLADDTKDAGNWTATVGTSTTPQSLPVGGLSEGDAVTLTYGGRLKVKSVTATIDAEPVTLATPLTVEALTAGTIKVNITDLEGSPSTLQTGMQYSVNGGAKTLITMTTPIEGLKAGDKVQFYGNGTQTQAYGYFPEVSILGDGDGFKTKVYGNIMSLLDEEGFASKTELPDAGYVFYELFAGNTTLIDASELLLPATTLTNACYQSMFEGCTNLTTAPKLPATTLAEFCYHKMFNGCKNLTSAYVKAAYTYTGENYECANMFDGCTATDAVLHTTPDDSKERWQNVMGTGKTWSNWTVADDWQD